MCYTLFLSYTTFFTDDSIENAVLNRQLTSSIEDILQILLTNDSVPVTQTYLMSLELIDSLTAMNSSNMFCSTAPILRTQPQNQTVLGGSQIHLSCNAIGDPSPTIHWYFNDSLLGNEKGAELKIDTATNENSGNYRCMAGNVVTDITSDDVFVLVKGKFYFYHGQVKLNGAALTRNVYQGHVCKAL